MSLLGWLLHIVGECGLSYSEGCVLFALFYQIYRDVCIVFNKLSNHNCNPSPYSNLYVETGRQQERHIVIVRHRVCWLA